mmetsp:Transcript_123564/g.357330  ORF Transcript_123564/g.357330 Transcript_123564/m.357330 type:complete len:147 (+) Transcript_123564:321-761(+)
MRPAPGAGLRRPAGGAAEAAAWRPCCGIGSHQCRPRRLSRRDAGEEAVGGPCTGGVAAVEAALFGRGVARLAPGAARRELSDRAHGCGVLAPGAPRSCPDSAEQRHDHLSGTIISSIDGRDVAAVRRRALIVALVNLPDARWALQT